MVKYCANCGRELPDEAMYCPECGKKFIPRQRADGSDLSDGSLSDYEFNGPFGASDKKFEGPFGPHSNRGSYDSSSVSSKGNTSSSPSGSTNSSGIFSNINSLNDNYRFNSQDIEGKGNIETNEPYNMSIDENTYLSGKGEVQLIDSNHSYNIESDQFNITEYETYYVNVDGEDWYVLDIFKCKFDTPAQSQVYSTDMDNGDPIIIYSGKGEYYGYGIIMPNSSNNSTYKNLDFLESIFHYKKE